MSDLGGSDFLNDLAVDLKGQRPLPLSLDGPSAFALIGMLQLVLRNPGLPENARRNAEHIKETLASRLGATETIRRAIAAGNDVTQDRRAIEPGAADRLLEACRSAQCSCTVKERYSGHRVGCWMPALIEAIDQAEGRES